MSPPGNRKIGYITGAHGLKGAVFVKPFSEDPEWVGKLKEVTLVGHGEVKRYKVASCRKQGPKIVTLFEEVLDRTNAEKLRGFEIWAAEGDLPSLASNEFYVDSLLNLSVYSADTQVFLGTIENVMTATAGMFLEVAAEGIKEPVLVPWQPVFVSELNLEEKTLYLTGLDDLFEKK